MEEVMFVNGLGEPQVSHDLDVADIAAYFIGQDALQDEPDVTPLKLQKLLYLAQANWLASTGDRLFDAPIEAFEHGPVVMQAWKRFQGREVICSMSDAPHRTPPLPQDVELFLEQVWVKFRGMSASALRNLTHLQTPWVNAYKRDAYRVEIEDEDIAVYFREEVPAAERVFHPDAVAVSESFFTNFDVDASSRRLRAFLDA